MRPLKTWQPPLNNESPPHPSKRSQRLPRQRKSGQTSQGRCDETYLRPSRTHGSKLAAISQVTVYKGIMERKPPLICRTAPHYLMSRLPERRWLPSTIPKKLMKKFGMAQLSASESNDSYTKPYTVLRRWEITRNT